MIDCYVVLKWSQRRDAQPEDVTVHSIHLTEQSVIDRMERVASANKQYPMRKVGELQWVVGPTEDEGFFGHSPVHLRAVKARLPKRVQP